jgi:hypothetical protein
MKEVVMSMMFHVTVGLNNYKNKIQPLSIKFRDWVYKKTPLEHLSPELLNIYKADILNQSRNFMDKGRM